MRSERVRVVLAAGGTGGHVFPAEAAAAQLRERGIEPVLLLTAAAIRSAWRRWRRHPRWRDRRSESGAAAEALKTRCGMRAGEVGVAPSLAGRGCRFRRLCLGAGRWHAGVAGCRPLFTSGMPCWTAPIACSPSVPGRSRQHSSRLPACRQAPSTRWYAPACLCAPSRPAVRS